MTEIATSERQSTREILIEAAVIEFNTVGYWGTDSNRLARAAGYAPGTFYKHFENKREIFLAAYELVGAREWAEIRAEADRNDADTMQRVFAVILRHHRERVMLRRSLRALVATDPLVRAVRLEGQQRQLDMIADVAERTLGTRPDTERCLLAALTVERVCDAIADGDTEVIGASESKLAELVTAQLEALGGPGHHPPQRR